MGIDYTKLNADELYSLLPFRVVDDKYEYFLVVHKVQDGVITEYRSNEQEDGRRYYFGNTYRKGYSLRESLVRMYKWLYSNEKYINHNREMSIDIILKN